MYQYQISTYFQFVILLTINTNRYLDSYGLEAAKYGVSHSDELWFLWNSYWKKHWVNRPEDQVNISNNMLDMWVNFARHGDPTPPGSDLPITWEPVTPDNHQYIILGRV